VVQATVVVLKNGDRMTGRIVKMENKRLEIDIPSAGIIKMKWEDVQSVTTKRPMSVMLYGEADLPEGAGERDLDRMIRSTLGEDGAIRLEDMRAINISGSLTCRIAEHRFLLHVAHSERQISRLQTSRDGRLSSCSRRPVARAPTGLRRRRMVPRRETHCR